MSVNRNPGAVRVLTCHVLLGACAFAQSSIFDYDASAPIDYKEQLISAHDSVRVSDASFTSPKGGRVRCYVVAPDRRGHFAGIVWQHGGSEDRSWFLPDAIAMAKRGAVSVLMDAPNVRPPEMRAPKVKDDAEQERNELIQVAVDARRSLDYLASRPDVDKDRIGYVGLSFGAMMGGSLAGVDHRFRTFILISGLEGFVRHWSESPLFEDMRKGTPRTELEHLYATVGPVDAIHFIGNSKPIPLLFQAADYDRGVPRVHTLDFFKAPGEPKELQWYATGHQINDPKALQDRINLAL